MPKRWLLSLAKLFPKPPKPPLSRWPSKWPSHKLSSRTPPARSQLRFTPIAAGKIKPWIIKCLIVTQGLLEKGENKAALAFCHEGLSEPAPFSLPGRYDFFHGAVSLFTRHRDFSAAKSLCDRMVEEGYVLSKKTNMVMMRGAHSHAAKQIQDVLDMMLHGNVQLDDLAFKSILDLMVLHSRPPEDLEAALKVYSGSRGERWVVPISVFGTIIQSCALAGQLDRAEQWLDKYRKVWAVQSKIQEPVKVSPPESAKQHDRHPELKLRRRSGILISAEDPHYPYAALLFGYAKSPKPVLKRIQSLARHLQSDGITPDIHMYNILIPALVGWGQTHRAFKVFRSLLNPETASLPDAYTFRHLFIALNPKRQRSPYERAPPSDLSARDLLNDMVKVVRLRMHPRKPQPHKNIISTATFNCALGTYCAQGDYAAAWTVLALFTRHHIVPNARTSRIVVLSLLRRMQTEVRNEVTIGEVVWTDRFMGQRRSTMLEMANKMMLVDHLYLIGRTAAAEMREEGYQTYLKPSNAFGRSIKDELEFLIALIRTSLQASLGFMRNTSQTIPAERAVSEAMYDARNAMIPRGRSERN
jgi:pentatricopeptide repeat protein